MNESYHDTPEQSTKNCPQCNTHKPLTAFSPDKHKASGYRSRCKACENRVQAERRGRNKPPRPVVQLPLRLFKVCRICKIEKPLQAFDPLAATCIECTNAKSRAKAHVRDVSQEPVPEGTQQCVKCERPFAFSRFYRSSYRTSGYSNVCKDCDDERKRQWTKDNPDKVQLQRENSYDPEEQRIRNQAYHQKNRERSIEHMQKYYEEHKEKLRIKRKEWAKNNLLKYRESNGRRRAHKKTTRVARIDYKAILERDGYWCHICNGIVEHDQVSFDHVIPLHRGGAHTAENLKIAHKICNSRKGTRLLSEMAPHQRRGV